MRVFVAGASGVVGPPLVGALREAGHEVTAMTRSAGKVDELRGLGAEPVVCDAFDAEALRAAVADAEPETVINQLTALPKDFNPRGIDTGPTNKLRREGGRNLIDAALAAGARR
jgi:nucleoside-diphosphate-sugar epimerase